MQKLWLKLAAVRAAVVLVVGFLFALQLEAASFDCGKAASPVEKLICSDAELSQLDGALSEAYKSVQNGQSADTLKSDQRAWLRNRNQCSDTDCLKTRYRQRIAALKAKLLSGEAGTKADTAAGEGARSLQSGAEAAEDPFAAVELENLDANWRLSDAEKVPIIREAFTSGRLVPSKTLENPPSCAAFPADFLAGKFEIIPYDYEALSFEDTLPDSRLPPEKVGKLPRNDVRTRWSRCSAGEDEEPIANEFQSVMGFMRAGWNFPPYRFYHAILDSGAEQKQFGDISLSRHGKYNQYYASIDLGKCASSGTIVADFPYQYPRSDYPTLSFMLRYRQQLMAVTYSDWSRRGEMAPKILIYLKNFSDEDICEWGDSTLYSR